MTGFTETNTPPRYLTSSAHQPREGGRGALSRLSLKPFGNELLTPSADFWIFSARLIIVSMALAEAIAWGYVGSLMSRQYPILTAAIAGSFVFVLIWVIDTSFMTLDLAGQRYESISSAKEKGGNERLRLFIGVGARIAIVTASLVITAPFLAQAIFSGDLRDEMNHRNATAVAEQRQRIEQPYLERIEDLRAEQRALEAERVEEAAGIGPSGRHGRGPAVETIERQLAEKIEEIRTVEATRDAALARFDELSPAELEQQYGLAFLTPGVHSSSALLEELSADSRFGRAELAVRAFLAFLFLGLLILKAFQPRSVAVYFSEQLHSLHDEYRKGIFDPYLPAAERAGSGGTIDPLRFEDWCLTTYPNIRAEERQRRETASVVRAHELLTEQWERLEDAARKEMGSLETRYENTRSIVRQLEAELREEKNRASSTSAELTKIARVHDSMLRHLEGREMDGVDFARAMDAVAEAAERRTSLEERMREIESIIEQMKKRLAIHEEEAAELRREIETKRIVIRDAQDRVSTDRIKLAGHLAESRKPLSTV